VTTVSRERSGQPRDRYLRSRSLSVHDTNGAGGAKSSSCICGTKFGTGNVVITAVYPCVLRLRHRITKLQAVVAHFSQTELTCDDSIQRMFRPTHGIGIFDPAHFPSMTPTVPRGFRNSPDTTIRHTPPRTGIFRNHLADTRCTIRIARKSPKVSAASPVQSLRRNACSILWSSTNYPRARAGVYMKTADFTDCIEKELALPQQAVMKTDARQASSIGKYRRSS